jgi:hypothetical protein
MKFLKHNHGLNKEQTEFLLKKHENHLKDHCYHYLFYYKFLENSLIGALLMLYLLNLKLSDHF